ncbi:biotin/lipoyl-binding protein [Pajaroellobacter abortibovis]|uniref:biotin/lipoyl-binding protein n=1 Tax=Pajaroellobacter abortibovis TaxID=1882918 RepID=UPI0015616C92|nr:biotin/lipoyl-binding protein [Pajaroellobacter abortibovis]
MGASRCCSWTGGLAAIQEADISFKAIGRLQTVRVQLGDQVKAGQVLTIIL